MANRDKKNPGGEKEQLKAVKETRKDGVKETYHVAASDKANFDAGFQFANKMKSGGKFYANGDSPGGNRPKDPQGTNSQPQPGSAPRGYSAGPFRLTKDPDKNLDQVSALAADLYNSHFKGKGNDSDAKEAAARAAIETIKGDPQANMSKVSIKSVQDTAFGTKAKKAALTGDEQHARAQAGKSGATKRAEEAAAGFDPVAARRNTPPSQRATYDQASVKPSGKILTEGKRTLKPGQQVAKSSVSNRNYLAGASTEEQNWINQQMGHIPVKDEKGNVVGQKEGLFYGAKNNERPGAYKKYQRYVSARQAGYSDRDNITDWLNTDGRGKSRPTNPKAKKALDSRYTEGSSNPQGIKAANRYKSMAPSQDDFGVGIKVPGIDSKSRLKSQNPNASNDDLVQMQSAQRGAQVDFASNTKMAHETRTKELLGKDASDTSASGDRVVFFTTSVGSPAISVGANSLVGQYIIQKRKQMLVNTKSATRSQVKGAYPNAVRDQHVIEVATGVNLGLQGRYGVFQHTGYRVGSKSSKGFGKPTPVGQQVMTDSSGRAMYDSNGNIRYTNGYTKEVNISPSNEVGLRVYLG